MDGDAIKQIQDAVQTENFNIVDDFSPERSVTLFTKPVHRMPVPVEPRAETLKVFSLQAVIDYVSSTIIDENDPEHQDHQDLHVHVVSYDTVRAGRW